MKKGFISLLLLLLCRLCIAAVTLYPVIEWQDMRGDTLLPYFGYRIPLEQGYADSSYSVSIEYPELKQLSESDIERWNLKQTAIPEWPSIETYISV